MNKNFLAASQHSGLQRAKWLAKTDAGIEKLLQAGAAQRLVNIIEDSKDRDCRKTALDVVEEMSRLYEAREAFVLAGGPFTLIVNLTRGFHQMTLVQHHHVLHMHVS